MGYPFVKIDWWYLIMDVHYNIGGPIADDLQFHRDHVTDRPSQPLIDSLQYCHWGKDDAC